MKKDFSKLSELMKSGLGKDLAEHRHQQESQDEKDAIGKKLGNANKRIWRELTAPEYEEECAERSRRRLVAQKKRELEDAPNKLAREAIQKQLDRLEKERLARKERIKLLRKLRRTK